jgi:excisionase family DNA binding protein
MLTVAQAAQRLGIKEGTLRLWLAQRRLTYCRLGRRAIRLDESEVSRLIREGTIPACKSER